MNSVTSQKHLQENIVHPTRYSANNLAMWISFVSHQKLMLALWNRVGRHTSLKCYRFIPKTAQTCWKENCRIEMTLNSELRMYTNNTKNHEYVYIYICFWKKETWSISSAPKTNRNRTSRNQALQMEFWTPKSPNVRDQGTHSESLPCPRVISSTRRQMQHLMLWHFVCNVWCPCKCNSITNES